MWLFSEDYVLVMNDKGLWGFIDKTGTEVIPCAYEDVLDFDNGFAKVKGRDGLWGFVQIPPQRT